MGTGGRIDQLSGDAQAPAGAAHAAFKDVADAELPPDLPHVHCPIPVGEGRVTGDNLANPAARQTLDNGTTVVNVERIELKTGAGDDTVTGGRSDDILDGGAGDDTLCGLGGRDELFGGDGNDTLILATGARVADGGMGTDYAELSFEEPRANLSFSVDANSSAR